MNDTQKANTSVQVFNNSSFGDIRTSWISEEPYFCLVDLCRILDLDNVSRVRSRLDERGLLLVPTLTEREIWKKPAEKFGGSKNVVPLQAINRIVQNVSERYIWIGLVGIGCTLY